MNAISGWSGTETVGSRAWIGDLARSDFIAVARGGHLLFTFGWFAAFGRGEMPAAVCLVDRTQV